MKVLNNDNVNNYKISKFRVDFSEIKFEIKKILKLGDNEKVKLIPDTIIEICELNNIQLKISPIKEWYEFENGLKSFSIYEIINWTNLSIFDNDEILIVTDDCFKENKGLKINGNHIIKFLDKTYFDIFHITFKQPFDMIFINKTKNQICIIQHDGFLIENINKYYHT